MVPKRPVTLCWTRSPSFMTIVDHLKLNRSRSGRVLLKADETARRAPHSAWFSEDIHIHFGRLKTLAHFSTNCAFLPHFQTVH